METTVIEETTPEETVSVSEDEFETTEPESEALTENEETETSSTELVTETESDLEEETIEEDVSSEEEYETTEEFLINDVDQIDAADAEAIVLAINDQTAEIQRGNVAICIGLGLLVGIMLVQGLRLRRI